MGADIIQKEKLCVGDHDVGMTLRNSPTNMFNPNDPNYSRLKNAIQDAAKGAIENILGEREITELSEQEMSTLRSAIGQAVGDAVKEFSESLSTDNIDVSEHATPEAQLEFLQGRMKDFSVDDVEVKPTEGGCQANIAGPAIALNLPTMSA